MKALVMVDDVNSIPNNKPGAVIVVTQLNWREVYHFLEGKTDPVYLFLHPNCDFELLLKLVENYKGDLAVYTSTYVSSVFLSRFTRVLNRKTIKLNSDFAKKSDLEDKVSLLKSLF